VSQLKLVTAVGAAAVILPAGSAVAAASPSDGINAERATLVPMSQVLRRCDQSDETHVPSIGHGTGVSIISSTGADVRADVSLQNATPDIRYFVRLIQVPPAASRCGAGDPGVAVGTLDTDDGGNGTATIQQAVLPGVKGAWVFIDGPPGYGTSSDFFSSDFIAPV